jgi:putative flippase GtrA
MNFQPALKQFLKFGVVGSIGAAIDFSSYGLLTRLLGFDAVFCVGFSGAPVATTLGRISACGPARYPVVVANMISVFLAISSNFFLNKFWTFRDSRKENLAAQGAGYLVLGVCAWALNQVLTSVFIARLTVLGSLFGPAADVAAKVLAIFVVLFFNFAGSKFVVFRRAQSVSVSA